MSNNNSKAERGSVIATILEVLKSGDKYGYEIIKEVEMKTGIVLKQPSLYSCLTRLENQGIITSYWTDSDIGGRRHYYKYLNNDFLNKEDNINLPDSPSPTNMENSEDKIILETINNPIILKNEFLNHDTSTYELTQIVNAIHNSDNKYCSELHSEGEPSVKKENLNQSESQEHEFKEEKNTSSIDPISVLHQLVDNQSEANLRLISFLKNAINASREKQRLESELISNSYNEQTTINFNSSPIKSDYKNILGDMLYESNAKPANTAISDFAQQAFNFDSGDIKVENDKKYLNNVLFKTATKTTKSTDRSSAHQKVIIEHYTNVGDLKAALNSNGVKIKEYSFINYQATNNNRFISIKRTIILSLLQLLIYSLLAFLGFKLNYFNNNISYFFISALIIQSIICAVLFFIHFFTSITYFKYKSFVNVIICFLEVLLCTLIAFHNNLNLLATFNIQNLLILIPFVFICFSLLFAKKAENF